ncbi:MAG: hypothetical protein KKC26_04775 [Nanoarchaeota archaeon]|nr:hypothetical protein [Nanoarchaeota archaeon]MBU1850285.1 hypothetical protein [Nanoarchaeota archaeon]
MKNITNISEYVKKLSKEKKEVFSRIFELTTSIGRMKIPTEMKSWVISQFGSLEAVQKQKIVRIDNKLTFETSLYNELRTKIPADVQHTSEVKKIIEEKRGGPFCNPKTQTPEDTFGRIEGKASITASNVAKYDAEHGLIIFKEHNPLHFKPKEIKDYLDVAEKWIKKVHEKNSQNKYPYILWNCLWKAGASLIHGHMQVLVGKKRHYSEIELLKFASSFYKELYNSDYFEDFYEVHKALGLGFEHGKNKIMVNLTAKKEKEVIIMGQNLLECSEAIYRVLQAYFNMNVESFNMGVYLPPMDNSWSLPLIIRLVDRGSLSKNTTDIGGMELFARSSIILSDPYKVLLKIKKEF